MKSINELSQKKNYIVTTSFYSPYVTSTGIPHNPTKIEKRAFKRGQIVSGVLVTADGQPAYVLKDGTFVLPLSNIKEMVTKDVYTGFDGDKKKPTTSAYPAPKKPTNPKVKYLDCVLIGAGIGAVIGFIFHKKGWIPMESGSIWKLPLAGAGLFGGIGLYVAYRRQNKNKPENKDDKK